MWGYIIIIAVVFGLIGGFIGGIWGYRYESNKQQARAKKDLDEAEEHLLRSNIPKQQSKSRSRIDGRNDIQQASSEELNDVVNM